MAPYTPSNHTLVPSKALLLPTHDLLSHLSLSTTVLSNAVSSTPPPDVSDVTFTATLPYLGIGPLVLQPSPSRPVDAEMTASAYRRDTSSRLAYLAILAIPLIFLVVAFLYMRRGKQKPAKHFAPQHTLRSEAARARADTEAPRMQQLPRDRIRAMNSVPRDQEVPISPPAEHQIFSPRPRTPPPSEYPHPRGICFASLSVPGNSEPPSPLASTTTSTSDLSVCPPTPCTPISSFPSEPAEEPAHEEPSSGLEKDEYGTEEVRFSWDFRCKGTVDRLSRFSAGSVLDISHANNAVTSSVDKPDQTADTQALQIQENAQASGEDINHITETADKTSHIGLASSVTLPVLPALELSEGRYLSALLDFASGIESDLSSSPSQDKFATIAPSLSTPSLVSDGDSTFNTTATSIILSLPVPEVEIPSGPKALIRSDEPISTNSDPIVLGLNLDVTSFSAQVSDALSSTPNSMLNRTYDSSLVQHPNDIEQQEPPKDAKRRPVLSKPNHRTLAPTTSSLKVHAPSLADVFHCASSTSTSSPTSSPCMSDFPIGPLNAMVIVGSHSYMKPRTLIDRGMGRSRASSETNLLALRKSCLSGTGINDYGISATLDSRTSELDNKPKDVFLFSSLSMPLVVELACLSSISKRIKAKYD